MIDEMVGVAIEGSAPLTVTPGRPFPLGATPGADGVDFAVFSEHAAWVELLLFDAPADPKPAHTITLPQATDGVWHAHVAGARPGMGYAYRAHGPADAGFNADVVLVDPYAHALETSRWDRADACLGYDNLETSLRGIVVDLAGYDWRGDAPPRRPLAGSVVYELHVGGFTRGPDAGVTAPGTFRGLIEKIPYLTRLGVTAVQLLPVLQFDPADTGRTGGTNPVTGERLSNYWGYGTIGFLAPHAGYCTDPAQGVREFRDLVRALHAAGIEVILDLALGRTGEDRGQDGEGGPVISFRGLDDAVYHRPDGTLDHGHPVVRKLVADCLAFWARDLHVDGFRFAEGTVPDELLVLADDLVDAKLVTGDHGTGDAGGPAYFPGHRAAGRDEGFRGVIRRFVAGEPGLLGEVAEQFVHRPGRSARVRYVTTHDGFTAEDLVTYSARRNRANGEGNADGIAQEHGWNCGAEGPTDDPAVRALRARQVKNLLALLLLAPGVPMLNMGDEVRRSQGGNNNAWCQDNPTSWFDWQGPLRHPDLLRFVQRMVGLRRSHPVLAGPAAAPRWHGTRLDDPGFADPAGRALALTLTPEGGTHPDLHVIANMAGEVLAFELPPVDGHRWRRVADTGMPGSMDIADPGDEVPIEGGHYLANPHTVVVLGCGPAA